MTGDPCPWFPWAGAAGLLDAIATARRANYDPNAPSPFINSTNPIKNKNNKALAARPSFLLYGGPGSRADQGRGTFQPQPKYNTLTANSQPGNNIGYRSKQ
jgi:hypothetical protein